VSKGQKERTNVKRNQRLGTGEGIAAPRSRSSSTGGVPPWAWLVAGAIVVAAVIVAVVLVTRSSGSASGGQNASCVQSRLSHDKLDALAEPTWPVNLTDLDCALTSLGLSPSAESQSATHYHAHLTLYVDGKKVLIPDNIALQNPPGMSSEIHTHDANTDPNKNGIIHVESPKPSFHGNLLQFFDVWGVYATNSCLGGYCDGVKVYVNGKPSPQGIDTVMQPHDAITVVVGNPPADFTPDKSYAFEPGE
jgi:hypothetical protein